MTTCRDIIALAYRFSRLISLDERPEGAEAVIGLDILQSMYDGWFAAGEFGILNDVYVSSDYTAYEGDRVTRSADEVITLPETYIDESPSYYPHRYHDYYYTNGKERPAFDFSAIEIVGLSRNIRDNGVWVNINDLTLDSPAPLTSLGKTGLAACLAVENTDFFGGDISPSTVIKANRFIAALRICHYNLAGV